MQCGEIGNYFQLILQIKNIIYQLKRKKKEKEKLTEREVGIRRGVKALLNLPLSEITFREIKGIIKLFERILVVGKDSET